MQAPGLGPILSTALRGLTALTDKATALALQFAPEDASPAVVRVAVSAGLVLLALSFVKSVLSVSERRGAGHCGGCMARQRAPPGPAGSLQQAAILRALPK